MFFKKKCPRCDRKIERIFEFCPYCGLNVKRKSDEKDYGFLGKDDFPNLNMRMPFGFDGMFNSLLKQIDTQFRALDKEIGNNEEKMKKMPLSRGISISISTATGQKPEIKVSGFGPGFQNIKAQEKKPAIKQAKISEEKLRQMAGLPRQEAETKVRRLSNRVIYEIDVQGVSSLNNVIINKLENSIEIKAFSDEKVYVKLLPLNLPILSYNLENEKLILELGAK